MTKDTFELGSQLEDKISGFKGIATARLEYLNGCVQYCLQPLVDKDGKAVEAEYFDQDQLIAVEAPRVRQPEEVKRQPTGGPVQGNPPKRYGQG